ncbi:MAG TPA: hypothetical protein VNW94_25395 [Streptosporangiaceae bacterium]|nr:hypothetical protein [Streptosporangiaceae bacterium]
MAAVVSVQRQALAEPLEVVLTRDPQRTGVLESVGLVRRSAGGFVVHPALRPADAPTARSGVEAKRAACPTAS